ncbi:hypothetical protein VTI74DRAFT_4277 [Chaetomium olivicolor]
MEQLITHPATQRQSIPPRKRRHAKGKRNKNETRYPQTFNVSKPPRILQPFPDYLSFRPGTSKDSHSSRHPSRPRAWQQTRVFLSVQHPTVPPNYGLRYSSNPVMNLPQPLHPVPSQDVRHLAEHHGLVFVRQDFFGNLELQVHVFSDEVAEENVHGLFLPARTRFL